MLGLALDPEVDPVLHAGLDLVLDPALDPVLDLALDPALNPASDPLLDRLPDLRWHLLEALYVFFFPPFTNFNEL